MPVVFYTNRYVLDLAILIATYTMLGFGLNIVVGLAGLLDLGYVAFYAVGAYSYALIAQNFGLSFWICLPLAGILCRLRRPPARLSGAAAARRLSGHRHARLRRNHPAHPAQLAESYRRTERHFREFPVPRSSACRLPPPTTALPRPSASQYSPTHRVVFLYYLILALALLTNWVTLRLRRLPIGRAWEALREDEIACRALGINTTTTKLTAFAMGAMFGGFAGAFFATRMGFISPESFTFGELALVLAIVVLGGMGSQLGVAVAATVMLGGFELFREFEQYRMLVFGAAMVAVMIYRPRGLVSTRTPSVFLHERKAIPAAIVRRRGRRPRHDRGRTSLRSST